MEERRKLLDKFREVNDRVKCLVDRYPPGKREQIIFDKWSLKDVVAHLSAWMEDDLNALNNLMRGEKSYWEPDVDAFNERGLNLRKDRVWDEVYKEFISLIEALNDAYNRLPEQLFHAEMWENHKGTPLRSLKVNIEHWEGEHIPSLESNLK